MFQPRVGLITVEHEPARPTRHWIVPRLEAKARRLVRVGAVNEQVHTNVRVAGVVDLRVWSMVRVVASRRQPPLHLMKKRQDWEQ